LGVGRDLRQQELREPWPARATPVQGRYRSPHLVHASKGMTRVEYERAAASMAKIGVRCPTSDELQFGGIIGSVLVVEIVTQHRSPWFGGPHALVLADPRPQQRFRPARGQVGLFSVESP
jgi:hypothetical protein